MSGSANQILNRVIPVIPTILQDRDQPARSVGSSLQAKCPAFRPKLAVDSTAPDVKINLVLSVICKILWQFLMTMDAGFAAAGIGQRLKQAREETGLNTRQVAERLGGMVSHATIANYEKGRTVPNVQVLSRLAVLYARDLTWFMSQGTALTGVRFRKTVSRVKVAEEKAYLSQAARWVEAYQVVEREAGSSLAHRPDIAGSLGSIADATPKEVAARLRQRLDMKAIDPVPSVVEVMEEQFGIRVLELHTPARIDGLAAKHGDESVVVINPAVPNDRGRLSLGHEFFHVLFEDCETTNRQDKKRMEDRAFEGGFYFLMPPETLRMAFQGKSIVKLVTFKERYGVSMAAMIYRAEKEGILKQSEAKHLFIEFAKRGWRQDEPGQVRADRATRLERLFEEVVAENESVRPELLRRMGVREEEIRERQRVATGTFTPVEEENEQGDADQEGGEGNPDVLSFPR